MNISISLPVGFTEIGRKDNQEDTLYPRLGQADAHQRVFLLCDGMGGHDHGEVASRCVADAIGSYVQAKLASLDGQKETAQTIPFTMKQMRELFEKGLEQAYDALDRLDDEASEGRGTMGTTLTFLAICSDGMLAAHIGDSRIYQFRPDRGTVFQTRDHSLVNELLAAGEISEEEARTYPRRNVITRAVQPHQDVPAQPTFDELTDIRRGDVLMLCCDGVTEQLDNADLERRLLASAPLADRIDAVRQLCAERHTRDNHTCWAFEVEQVDGAHQVKAKPQAAHAQHGKTSSQSAPSQHGWVLALLAALALCCFVAGYLFFGRTSAQQDSPVQSTPHQVKTPVPDSDDGIQGTVKRQRRK